MTDERAAAPPFPCNAQVRHVDGQVSSGPTRPAMPEHYVIDFPDGRTVRAVPVDLYRAEHRNLSYEDRTNERLAALGGGSVRQGLGDRWTLTEGTLEMLLRHAEADV